MTQKIKKVDYTFRQLKPQLLRCILKVLQTNSSMKTPGIFLIIKLNNEFNLSIYALSSIKVNIR